MTRTYLSPPHAGGAGGVVPIPIDLLNVGDLVYSHDGRPHRILETFRCKYSGPIFHIVTNNKRSLHVTEALLILAERRVKHLTPSGKWTGVPPRHFRRARMLRQAMSPPEVAIWCALRGNQMGVKFRKQHPIGPYIADFYSHECGLVVEVDGAQHFDSEEAQAYDRERDAFMENLGLTVLRFSTHDVGMNLEGVLGSIHRKGRQCLLKSDPTKQWCLPEALHPGIIVPTGTEASPVRLKEITARQRVEDVFNIRVEGAGSFSTDACFVHGLEGDNA